MDLSILSSTINEIDSIISTQNKDDSDSKIDPPKKSFPTDVLKWMKKNASPKMALKLMQICKYFKHKEFPYFVVKRISGDNDDFSYHDLKDVRHEWENISAIAKKLWISDEIHISQFQKGLFNISQLTSKIAVCDAKRIQLFDLEILFNDFKILTFSGTVRHLICERTTLCKEINEIVPFEDILACVPNIEEIEFCFMVNENIPSFSTIEAAKKEWILPNLKLVELRNLDEYFNVAAFIEFMKNHKSVIFELRFCSFDYTLRLQLQTFVDEIIAAADLRYPPPLIEFPFQTKESTESLKALFHTVLRKHMIHYNRIL